MSENNYTARDSVVEVTANERYLMLWFKLLLAATATAAVTMCYLAAYYVQLTCSRPNERSC